MQNGISTEWPIEGGYGVCRLSIINIFQEPRLGSGLITQLLFGETYRVLDQSACLKWIKIVGFDDTGEGWMLALQHQNINHEEYNYFNDIEYQITTSPISTITFRGELIHLLPGSNIHISNNEIFDIDESIKFGGECRSHSTKASREEICKIALSFLNVPELLGGRSFFGIGAGAFVHMVYKIGGYNFPRFLSQIVEEGKKLLLNNSQPGDILIFTNDKQIHDHVGIYLGNGEMIHVNGKVAKNFVNLNGDNNSKNISSFWHVHGVIKIM